MLWVPLVVGLVVLLSLVPLSMDLSFRTAGQIHVEVMPRWGALSLGTWHPRVPSAWPRTKKAPGAREGRMRGGRQVTLRKLRALLSSDDFLASIGRWLQRMTRLLAPSDVRLRLRFGTGDPCQTGRMWAVLAPHFALFAREAWAQLDLVPDFVDEVFDLDAHARFRIVPLVLVATTLGYFFTPAPWRAVRNYARA